jgi:hypothetical protein
MTVDPTTSADAGASGAAHLSFFALDGLRLGRSPVAAEREHLGGCQACADHLRRPAPGEVVPGWLAQAEPSPVRAPARAGAGDPGGARRSLWWAGFGASSLAAAAAVLLLVRPPGSRPARPTFEESAARSVVTALGGGVRAKGTVPATRLYVKRGDDVWVWDGQTPIRPGDRLRLELQAAGYSHVSVASTPTPGQGSVVLHQGDLREGAGLLPISFRVDAQGTREIISVILADQPVAAVWHTDAGAHLLPPGSASWRQVLILPKENPR